MAGDLNSEPTRSKSNEWSEQNLNLNLMPTNSEPDSLTTGAAFSAASHRSTLLVFGRDSRETSAFWPQTSHTDEVNQLTRQSSPAMGSNESQLYLQATGAVYLLINHRTYIRRSVFSHC